MLLLYVTLAYITYDLLYNHVSLISSQILNNMLTLPMHVRYLLGGCEANSGRHLTDGGHGTIQRGIVGCDEATMGRQWRPGLLQPLERIPAERLR